MLVNRASLFLVLAATLSPAVAFAAPPTKEQCIAANEAEQYLREAHKLREAREKLLLCVSDACPGPVREDCAQRLDEVTRATPSIVFEVKDAAGHDVPGVQISLDGRAVAGSAGTAIEVDPGEHTFAFVAGGGPATETRRLVIVEGIKERHETVVMKAAATAVSGVEVAPTASDSPASQTETSHLSGPPVLSWVAFGVGGVGLAVGVIAGVIAGDKHSTLAGECDNGAGTCAPQYVGDLDGFHSARTWSTVGYVVGALGVAGGAVLWFTAPKGASTTAAHLWLGPASAGVAGSF